MTSTHIDQLAQWYKDAERITKTNLPHDGDSIIYPRFGGGGYTIETDTRGWVPELVPDDEECRILSRAPKPEPAWLDAVAVIAGADHHHLSGTWRVDRGVFERTTDRSGQTLWVNNGNEYEASDLSDVTPLIEARVTDEMVARIRELHDGYGNRYFASPDAAYDLLEIALGLDPDTEENA